MREGGPLAIGVSFDEFDWLSAVVLRLVDGSEYAYAVDIDTDEVVEADPSEVVGLRVDRTAELLGSSSSGWHIMWAWTLENHQGYLDSIQFFFRPVGDGGDEILIQLLAMSSRLRVYELEAKPVNP